MEPAPPVLAIELFPEERAALLSLLEGLADDQWAAPTVCPGWSAKDVALHLWGDEVSILSRSRDGFQYGQPTFQNEDIWDELVVWLNQRNQAWVESTRHISSGLLCELLGFTGEGVYQYFKSLDPYELCGSVTWAGPQPAPKWLDIAREYTERWVHHQQIRDAVEIPGLKDRRFLGPVLETFVRALPHTYRDVDAVVGAAVVLEITGEAGGSWSLVREGGVWILYQGAASDAASRVVIEQELAWRLFTKGVSGGEARGRVVMEGDAMLAERMLEVVSIIA